MTQQQAEQRQRAKMRTSAYLSFQQAVERARIELLKRLEFISNARIILDAKQNYVGATWPWHQSTPIERGEV